MPLLCLALCCPALFAELCVTPFPRTGLLCPGYAVTVLHVLSRFAELHVKGFWIKLGVTLFLENLHVIFEESCRCEVYHASFY